VPRRLRRLLRWILVPPAALACLPLDAPLPPESDPDGATCQEMCAHMTELRCEIAGAYCVEDCEFIESTRGQAGQVKKLDLGCMAHAESCEQAKLCE